MTVSPPKSEVLCLDPNRLELFLERRRRGLQEALASETSLAENLIEVLNRANEFVPSDAGSILLDNPTVKVDERAQNRLTFIAAFGEKAERLAGQEIDAQSGIAGHVYLTGEPYYTGNAREDRFFNAGVDEATEYETQCLVAIPIRLGDSVCGVLELIREEEYTEPECQLLEIFAGYLSVSIQNVLDARSALAIAKRDNLTGLFNDRYLHIALADALEQADAEGTDVSLMFLDLDHFKNVNDNHGHLAGSQVLNEVGRLLAQACKPFDGLACRYGGDEFVVILPGKGVEAATELAETIRERIVTSTFCESPGSIQTEPLHLKGLSASIGVASRQTHLSGATLQEARTQLIHQADGAMYQAKETGRNRTVVASPSSSRISSSAKSPSTSERSTEATGS